MAALSAARVTDRRETGAMNYPVAASSTIYKGSLVAIDTDGYLVPASDTASLKVVGVASETRDNSSGSDGDLDCEVRTGTFKFAATSIAQTSLPLVMYVVDDQTFDETDPGNSVVAGLLLEVISATEGWILVDPIIGMIEAESDLLDGVTAGTVTASKAVVVDSNKDIGDFRNLDAQNIDAGASGTAGTVDVFPSTASKGKLQLACTDQTGDTTVTINANAMGQATTVNIADPGAAASYLVQSTAALTLAEADILDGATVTTAELNFLDGVLTASDTWDPGNLIDGAQESKDFTVTGAALGDFALVGAGVDVTDLIVSAVVTNTNVVTVTIANETGGAVDLASSTWYVATIPHP